MALTVGNVSDNPFQPQITGETYLPDQLIAGDAKLVTQDVVLLSGENRKRGAVLGQITIGAVTSAVKGGGNTGNGTNTLLTAGIKAKVGVYTLRFTGATAFTLVNPLGIPLPAAAALGAYANPEINFTVTAGGTPFIAGDGFDITVAAGSGKAKLAVATAVDGSAVPVGILVDDTDATAGDQNCGIYQTGEFNSAKIILDASYSVASITPLLRALYIFLKTPITAADPS